MTANLNTHGSFAYTQKQEENRRQEADKQERRQVNQRKFQEQDPENQGQERKASGNGRGHLAAEEEDT